MLYLILNSYVADEYGEDPIFAAVKLTDELEQLLRAIPDLCKPVFEAGATGVNFPAPDVFFVTGNIGEDWEELAYDKLFEQDLDHFLYEDVDGKLETDIRTKEFAYELLDCSAMIVSLCEFVTWNGCIRHSPTDVYTTQIEIDKILNFYKEKV